jgi:nitrate/nitrite transporter NarK
VSGRYRIVAVLCATFAVGVTWGHFAPPWWAGLLLGAAGGWFAEGLARWIGAVKP